MVNVPPEDSDDSDQKPIDERKDADHPAHDDAKEDPQQLCLIQPKQTHHHNRVSHTGSHPKADCSTAFNEILYS